MAVYRSTKPRHRLPRRVALIIAVVLLLLVGSVVVIRHQYFSNLKPLSPDQTTQIVTIKPGSSVKQIASLLHDQHLVRSAWAFEWYVHSKELSDKLQAGTYAFSPSVSVQSMVGTLTQGKVTTRLVTIVPGKRLDQVRTDFINNGFTPSAVDSALSPAQYSDLPVLAFKPANIGTLEGLLYPDSFQKDAGTDPSVIIRESLVEMGQKLTPDLQAAFAAQGLSTYQAIILASIIEQEVAKPADKPQVAQVFLRRLHSDIPLGSDATDRYASVLSKLNPGHDYSAYETSTNPGLPPAPINVVSESALAAVAHPAGTDWLFFVSGDDGVTHFSHTLQEHQALTQQYCHKLCAQTQ